MAEEGKLLRLSVALRMLGLPNTRPDVDRLRARLRERERELGRKLMVRGTGGKAPKLRVTLAVVRRECQTRSDLRETNFQRALREHFRSIDRHIEDATAEYVSEHIEPRFGEIESDVDELKSGILHLGQRLDQIASLVERERRERRAGELQRVREPETPRLILVAR